MATKPGSSAGKIPGKVRRWVGRTGRRVRRKLTGPRATFVYHPSYSFQLPGAPLDGRRGEQILTFLVEEGLAPRGSLRWPRPASLEDLARVHTEEYMASLRDPGALVRIVGHRLADFEEEQLLDVQRAMVGGTKLAVKTAIEDGGPVINLGGGLHHARPDGGHGFCIFDDVAVAIRTIRADGFDGNVLVVDLDLHDGDGTRAAFRDDPSVHTFSIHNHHWGPTEAVASTALALGTGVDDATYLDALRKHLPPVVRRFRPKLAVFLAGVDPAADDALGDWEISAEGLVERDRFVVDTLHDAGDPPLVAVLAGGYGPRAWAHSARSFGALLSGQVIEPPDRQRITLDRYRLLRELLAPSHLSSDPDETADNPFGLTDADLLGGLDAEAVETRFLGFYSKHGVEHALERFGLLARLREMGFRHPTVELELENPMGQTIRIFGDVDKKELVGELRARRDRATLPDFELLRSEWLLLQDPRPRPGAEVELRPGQKHPGLGLFPDVASILVLMCERLGLDGIVQTASHYHLAARSQGLMEFLDDEEAHRFAAFERALAGLSEHDAAWAASASDKGRVVDAATAEPVAWEPVTLVLPVSERLDREMRRRAARREDEGTGNAESPVYRLEPPPSA